MTRSAPRNASHRTAERTAREVFFAMLLTSVGCLLVAASSLGLLA